MANKKALVVDDDVKLVDLLRLHLEQVSFDVDCCHTGQEAVDHVRAEEYSLLVLDGMLPDIDGLDVLRAVREVRPTLAIIMLTARSEELDKVAGLKSGADDYITKPFQLAEFVARVEALMRRIEALGAHGTAEDTAADLQFGALSIEASARRVFIDGQEVQLTAREFDLLYFLASTPGKAFTRDEILETVWDSSSGAYDGSIYVIIKRLRDKIGTAADGSDYIETIRGVGYRFRQP